MIKNPCRQICKYDKNKICIGCKRTMIEAVNWINYSEEEKAAVLKNIETRIIHEFPEDDLYDYYV